MQSIKGFTAALSLVFCLTAQAADPVAGTATILVGTVSSVAPNGATRVLSKDDAVFNGDRITTGNQAYVRFAFVDGSSIVLRPNTEFAIEKFKFSETAAAQPSAAPKPDAPKPTVLQVASQSQGGNQAIFRLVRGGFRAVSGLIGKVNRQEYAVTTPVATIGIRGTVFFSVACEAACAADGLVSANLPAGEAALGGAISGVDEGGIALTSLSGNATTVNASQFVLTTAKGIHVRLPSLPGFLAGENWLGLADKAATATSASQAPKLPASVSPLPVGSVLGAAALAGALVIVVDSSSGNGSSTAEPSAGTPSTTR